MRVKRVCGIGFRITYLSAAKQGAFGAIIIHTPASVGYPFQVGQTSWTGKLFELPAGDELRNEVNAWVTEESARARVERAVMKDLYKNGASKVGEVYSEPQKIMLPNPRFTTVTPT